MADMKLYSHDEALNIVLGEKGTIARDNYETEMSSYLMGEAIREARSIAHQPAFCECALIVGRGKDDTRQLRRLSRHR